MGGWPTAIRPQPGVEKYGSPRECNNGMGGAGMKVSDLVAIAVFAISLTALFSNLILIWLKWPRIIVEVAVRQPMNPAAEAQAHRGTAKSEGHVFVLTIINNGSEPVTIKSMGFEGSGTKNNYRLDFLDKSHRRTGTELPNRRGGHDELVLPVRIEAHDCHVYEYNAYALAELPPDVKYNGYAQRYKGFRWWPNRPVVSETKSRETVIWHAENIENLG